MLISNHIEFISVLYIIFSAIGMISIIKNIYKTHRITIMSMCRVMYIMILCVVPALILYGQAEGINIVRNISFEARYLWTFYAQLVLTVIGYIIFNFGYSIKQRNGKEHSNGGSQNLIVTAIVFSMLSLVSLFLWASGYNGITGLLTNANAIRAGWLSSSNSFAFFKHFVPLSLLASWMLFNSLLRKTIKNISRKIIGILFLVCDILISSIYIQANDGRLLLAVYILLFFIIYLKYKYEVEAQNMAPIVIRFGVILIIVLFILFNADTILRYLRGQTIVSTGDSGILQTLSGEFSFIVSGTQTALSQWTSGEAKLMIGNDIVNGLFAWIPTSFKPFVLEDVWNYNTKIINSGSYGQSPTSIVAQSFYDLSWIGIIIIPFIYGVLIKKIEKILEARKDNIFFETVYVVLGVYLCKGIAYFSLYNIMINIFFIFIGIAIYSILQRVRL